MRAYWACQSWFFVSFLIKCTVTVSRFAPLYLSSVPQRSCLHLSPFTFPGNLAHSLPLKYSFSPSVSISNSQICACLFPLSTSLVQRILCLPFFLSFFLSIFLAFFLSLFLPPSSFSISVTLSCSLMRFHSLSVLCQPPLARERMSILSDVPCTNHPHTATAQRRRLAQLMRVECKYPCACPVLGTAHSPCP